jgi:transcriptional regulator GlxA family with amidase domain
LSKSYLKPPSKERFSVASTENLSLEEVAEYMQVSVRTLYRRFKEMDLESPKDYIKEYRINLAAKLLRTTSLTVQEIMYKTGFANRSHFYKEFSKHFQVTPKDYRNKYNKKETEAI